MIPFGEWLPDAPDYNNPGMTAADGIIPKSDRTYGPLGQLSNAVSAQIGGDAAERVCGAGSFRDDDGDTFTFAGRIGGLYQLQSTAWTDVSTSGGYSTAIDGFFRLTSFGNRVIATNFDDPVQSYVMGTSTAFANLSGSAPKARHVAVIGDFLMLGNTFDSVDDARPNRVWWSAQNDPTSWPTPGTTAAAAAQSDYQDFPSGGWVQGITGAVGGADGVIFQDRAIRRIVYTGPPTIFAFQEVDRSRGCIAPNSIVNVGDFAFYLAEDDFYAFNGQTSQALGAGKIAKHFFSKLDQDARHLIYGAADTINKIVFWTYPENGGAGDADRLIMFNWETGMWTEASNDFSGGSIAAYMIFEDATQGYTVDGPELGPLDIDDPANFGFPLDSRVWTGGKPVLSVISSGNRLQRFSATARKATLDTPEVGGPTRQYVSGIKPYVDVATVSDVTVSLRTRDEPGASITTGSAVATGGDTWTRFHADTRFVRARVQIAAGASWNNASGVDIDMKESGGL